MKSRIYIVEDHPSLRESIAGFLSHLPDTEVCGTAASAEDALEHMAETQPDLALIDVSMPAMNGLDFLSEAKKRWPKLRCLMLTGHDEAAYAERAFSLGAQGYVTKGDAGRLLEAIRKVLKGETYRPEPWDTPNGYRPGR